MELTKADQERVVKWLTEKCGQFRCFCCGTYGWSVEPIATMPVVVDVHTTRVHYHAGVPQITVVCRNCGHLVYFSAGTIGFKPDVAPEPVSNVGAENTNEPPAPPDSGPAGPP